MAVSLMFAASRASNAESLGGTVSHIFQLRINNSGPDKSRQPQSDESALDQRDRAPRRVTCKRCPGVCADVTCYAVAIDARN